MTRQQRQPAPTQRRRSRATADGEVAGGTLTVAWMSRSATRRRHALMSSKQIHREFEMFKYIILIRWKRVRFEQRDVDPELELETSGRRVPVLARSETNAKFRGQTDMYMLKGQGCCAVDV